MNTRKWLWLHELSHAVVGEYLDCQVSKIQVFKTNGFCHYSPKDNLHPLISVAPYFTLAPQGVDHLYDSHEYEKTINESFKNKLIIEYCHEFLSTLSDKFYFNFLYKFMKRQWRESVLEYPIYIPRFKELICILKEKYDIKLVNDSIKNAVCAAEMVEKTDRHSCTDLYYSTNLEKYRW